MSENEEKCMEHQFTNEEITEQQIEFRRREIEEIELKKKEEKERLFRNVLKPHLEAKMKLLKNIVTKCINATIEAITKYGQDNDFIVTKKPFELSKNPYMVEGNCILSIHSKDYYCVPNMLGEITENKKPIHSLIEKDSLLSITLNQIYKSIIEFKPKQVLLYYDMGKENIDSVHIFLRNENFFTKDSFIVNYWIQEFKPGGN